MFAYTKPRSGWQIRKQKCTTLLRKSVTAIGSTSAGYSKRQPDIIRAITETGLWDCTRRKRTFSIMQRLIHPRNHPLKASSWMYCHSTPTAEPFDRFLGHGLEEVNEVAVGIAEKHRTVSPRHRGWFLHPIID